MCPSQHSPTIQYNTILTKQSYRCYKDSCAQYRTQQYANKVKHGHTESTSVKKRSNRVKKSRTKSDKVKQSQIVPSSFLKKRSVHILHASVSEEEEKRENLITFHSLLCTNSESYHDKIFTRKDYQVCAEFLHQHCQVG